MTIHMRVHEAGNVTPGPGVVLIGGEREVQWCGEHLGQEVRLTTRDAGLVTPDEVEKARCDGYASALTDALSLIDRVRDASELLTEEHIRPHVHRTLDALVRKLTECRRSNDSRRRDADIPF